MGVEEPPEDVVGEPVHRVVMLDAESNPYRLALAINDETVLIFNAHATATLRAIADRALIGMRL